MKQQKTKLEPSVGVEGHRVCRRYVPILNEPSNRINKFGFNINKNKTKLLKVHIGNIKCGAHF